MTQPIPSRPETALQQLTGLLRDYGLRETVRYLPHALNERWWRWRFGIQRNYVHLSKVGIHNPLLHNHGMSHYSDFRKVMGRLTINPERDVFIDYGSGMGAVVLMAATYPFRRILGVELAPEFNAEAQRLVERNRHQLVCRNIELVVADATAYPVPPEVTVAYFFNPFRGAVLAQVFANLRASLAQTPRKLTVVFLDPWSLQDVPDRDEWLIERWRMKCYNDLEYAVLEST